MFFNIKCDFMIENIDISSDPRLPVKLNLYFVYRSTTILGLAEKVIKMRIMNENKRYIDLKGCCIKPRTTHSRVRQTV